MQDHRRLLRSSSSERRRGCKCLPFSAGSGFESLRRGCEDDSTDSTTGKGAVFVPRHMRNGLNEEIEYMLLLSFYAYKEFLALWHWNLV